MKRVSIVLAAAFLAAPGIVAQDGGGFSRAQKERRTDEVFAEWDSEGSPGCAVGIILDGALIYTKGFGSGNLDHGVGLDRTSVFYIASTSKQFTAAAIAELINDGEIDMDDPVQTYVPELPEYEWPVRIRHLVHHTSGLRDYLTLMILRGQSFEDYWDNAGGLALLARQEALNFEPGSEYLYSNSGYILMAEIIERVSGMTLQEFTRERFFEPLGMDASHWGEDRTAVVPNRVTSYSLNDDGAYRGWLKNFHGKGDGNLLTTVEDLARWDRIFYSEDPRWRALVERMLTPGALNDGSEQSYAYGLVHGEYRDRATVSHGGGLLGFRTEFMRFPAERFSAICLCNLGSINPGRLARALADIWLFETAPEWLDEARPATPDENEAEPTGPAPELTRYAGSYYSRELDVTFEVSVEDEGLHVETANGREVLEYDGPDAFRSGGIRFEFAGGSGPATGFALHAGRVRGIAFERR